MHINSTSIKHLSVNGFINCATLIFLKGLLNKAKVNASMGNTIQLSTIKVVGDLISISVNALHVGGNCI